MTRVRAILVGACLCLGIAAWGDVGKNAEAGVGAGVDVAACIGMGLSEAYERFGAPDSVFVYRGEEIRQDDVVFYFDDHVYLFWYADRLWQMRFDHRYTGVVLGVRMGDTRAKVAESVGEPFEELGDSLVFFLPDSSQTEGASRGSYPLRFRAFFLDAKLHDAYVYRGDF